MHDKELSSRQHEILTFIKKYMVKYGSSPSVRDIANGVNLNSPATVHVHLQNLINFGFLRRNSNQELELMVPNEFDFHDSDAICVPLLDQTFPDDFIKILDDPDDFFYLSAQMIPRGSDVFVLKLAKSISFFNYFENDYLIVEKRKKTSHDGIFVGVYDEKIVLFSKEYNSSSLSAEEIKNISLLGKVVGLYREF